MPRPATLPLVALVALVALAASAPAAATDAPACSMTYSAFEYAIPHLDLDECPAAVAREGAFCRASLANDALPVFVFALQAEQCLLEVRSYAEEEITLIVP